MRILRLLCADIAITLCGYGYYSVRISLLLCADIAITLCGYHYYSVRISLLLCADIAFTLCGYRTHNQLNCIWNAIYILCADKYRILLRHAHHFGMHQ